MKLTYRNQRNAELTAQYWRKPLDSPEWFKVENKVDDQVEIFIYDVIGWPFVDAFELVNYLSGIKGGTITVRINSPGGDVFDGMAIYHALQQSKARVVTRIEGLASSIASVVSLGGSEVQARKGAMMMIHEPWTVLAGNQHELREVADVLDKISGNLLDAYYDKTGQGKRELKEMMKNETWFTAKEAKERGLVDTIVDASAAKARFDLSMFANAPDGIGGDKAGRDLNEREIERALRDAGASRSFAKAVVADRVKALRDVEAMIAAHQVLTNMKSHIRRNA